MPKLLPQTVRAIASQEVERYTGGTLDPKATAELVTGLSRQWLTYDGRGVLFREDGPVWFLIVATENGFEVGRREELPGSLLLLMNRNRVTVDNFPEVCHRLTVAQSVVVKSWEGKGVRLWADPKVERVYAEDAVE